jgi:hypothetical protein
MRRIGCPFRKTALWTFNPRSHQAAADDQSESAKPVKIVSASARPEKTPG